MSRQQTIQKRIGGDEVSQVNLERIQDALAILTEEGRKKFKTEVQKDIPVYQCIGMAIASANDSARNVLQLAYAALEDWNYHDLCAVIEWAHPLFDQTFHSSDLQRLSRRINKQGVTVLTEWDAERQDYKNKVVNVKIVIEDVE